MDKFENGCAHRVGKSIVVSYKNQILPYATFDIVYLDVRLQSPPKDISGTVSDRLNVFYPWSYSRTLVEYLLNNSVQRSANVLVCGLVEFAPAT